MTGQTPKGDPVEAGLHEVRVDAAATARRRSRWVAERAAADRTLRDLLAGLVGDEVLVALTDGSEVRGRVAAVGADAVELDVVGDTLLVAAPQVVTVQATVQATGAAAPRAHPAAAADGWTLAETLLDLADSGRPVRLGLVGPHAVTGEVVAVGRTLTVRTAAGLVVVDPAQLVTVQVPGA